MSVEETARMTKYYRMAYAPLRGRTVIDVRAMYPEEMELFIWHGEPGVVIELDDGNLVVPMSDAEGNAPGQLMMDKGE